jgi:hypothetical protein
MEGEEVNVEAMPREEKACWERCEGGRGGGDEVRATWGGGGEEVCGTAGGKEEGDDMDRAGMLGGGGEEERGVRWWRWLVCLGWSVVG